MIGDFSTSLTGQDEDTAGNDHDSYFKNSIGNHEIIELKGNFIPKGLVSLERLFSNNDTLLKPIVQSSEETIVRWNIGTTNEPKLAKLSKVLSDEQRRRYIKLMKEFVDIFTWYYEYLNTYETRIIQYKAPLKPNTNTIR